MTGHQTDKYAVVRTNAWRRGFTLIEMLVSLAVLVVALTVVGVVFGITTKTTSQSQAYSEVHNWVRQWEEQIREDLRGVDPAHSVLVILGRKVPAALTKADLDAGLYHRVLTATASTDPPQNYDPQGPVENPAYSSPRADTLMFITYRPGASQAPPADPSRASPLLAPYAYAAAGGGKFSPQLVVYSHASFVAPQLTNNAYGYPPTNPTNIDELVNGRSPIPAINWHLARKGVFLVPTANGTVYFNDPAQRQRFARCQADDLNGLPGDMAFFDLDRFLRGFDPDPLDNFYAVLIDPYRRGGTLNWADWNLVPPAWNSNVTIAQSLQSLLYADFPNQHNIATVLTDVPVELRSNMGVHMLPGCTWFEVEFLMPEDPRNSIRYAEPVGRSDPNNPAMTNYSSRADMPRWTEVEVSPTGQPIATVFVPDTQANRQLLARQVGPAGGPPFGPLNRLVDFARLDQNPLAPGAATPGDVAGARVIRTWPYAIRVTVHAYDPHGRLPEPLVRTVVHRFE